MSITRPGRPRSSRPGPGGPPGSDRSPADDSPTRLIRRVPSLRSTHGFQPVSDLAESLDRSSVRHEFLPRPAVLHGEDEAEVLLVLLRDLPDRLTRLRVSGPWPLLPFRGPGDAFP